MTLNFLYDALNDFGKLTAAGTFPNTLNMGEATAERMCVDLKLPNGKITGTGNLTVAVQGSNAENSGYVALVTSGNITVADLNAEGYSLPIPKSANKYKYLRVALTGTITAGTVQAILNTYIGK